MEIGGGKSLLVGQWNLGSKFWERKIDLIQAAVDDKKPDLMYITEANIMGDVPDYKIRIEGYNLIKPKAAEKLGYS